MLVGVLRQQGLSVTMRDINTITSSIWISFFNMNASTLNSLHPIEAAEFFFINGQ